MDWNLFIGRFHPLIVHLPIGIFILGYVFEILFQMGYRNIINSRKIIIITYCFGLVAGLIAALTGWLLSYSNDYGIEPLNDHKYLGIATLVLMTVVIIYQVKAPEGKAKFKLGLSTVVILLTGLTGHFGGNLTHGPSYLVEYGPEFLKGENHIRLKSINEINPDSIQIYTHLIHPLLENKCMECHNSESYKGGLNLEEYSNLFKESDHGQPITKGSPSLSELFTRISLPPNHEKAMPPRGLGFGYTDIQVLKYWIENGADSLAMFNTDNMSKELIDLINRDYGLDYNPKPYYERVKVDRPDEILIEQLRQSGFRVSYLGETNFLLDVAYKNDSISKVQYEALNKVSDYVTILKLTDCNLTDDFLKELTPMKHLTQIDVRKNNLAEGIVTFLTKHEHLESVNLNETNLTSELLGNLLSTFNDLRVYVINTKITPEELVSLTQTYTNAEIVSEFKFEKVDQAKSVFRQELNN